MLAGSVTRESSQSGTKGYLFGIRDQMSNWESPAEIRTIGTYIIYMVTVACDQWSWSLWPLPRRCPGLTVNITMSVCKNQWLYRSIYLATHPDSFSCRALHLFLYECKHSDVWEDLLHLSACHRILQVHRQWLHGKPVSSGTLWAGQIKSIMGLVLRILVVINKMNTQINFC